LPLPKSLTKQEIVLVDYKSNQADGPQSINNTPSTNSQSSAFGGIQAGCEPNLKFVQIYQVLVVDRNNIAFYRNPIH